MRWMNRAVRTLVVAALMPGTTGCLTHPLWAEAEPPAVVFDRVAGVTPPGANGRRWLIAEYGDGKDKRVVRVPLDGDGRPAPPYEWVGITDERSASDVSDHQRQAVDRAAAPQLPGSKLDRLAVPAIGTDVTTDGSVMVAAFRINPDGRLERASVPKGATTLPADVRAVVLPADRPASRERRQSRQLTAVALTPLAVAGDTAIVLTGVGLVVGVVYALSWVDRHTDFDDSCDDPTARPNSHRRHR